MAIIAIFCDGTWNRLDADHQTHVARLASACARDNAQHVIYLDGVGTSSRLKTRFGRWIHKMGGGVFGWGLDRNIKIGYQALCRIYRPGDRIMVFGFSRGAYTARSLVGMIRKCGILDSPSRRNVSRAFRLYRLRGPQHGPDAAHIRIKRRKLSPRFATSSRDVIGRGDGSALVRIAYLGVWDTVGALGIPESLLGRLARLWNRRYAFHDTQLTHLVEQARHAVALDERRVTYGPSLWGNLDSHAGRPGLNGGDASAARPYQQMWFAGNHSVVGGASAPSGLGAASLDWILSGARTLGLRLRSDDTLSHIVVDVASAAPDLYRVRLAYAFLPHLLRWRDGPAAQDDLHATARLRAALVPGYRPLSLRLTLPEYFRL